eukprot:10767546-Heterocapsa_arctica.AAC.1
MTVASRMPGSASRRKLGRAYARGRQCHHFGTACFTQRPCRRMLPAQQDAQLGNKKLQHVDM